MYDIFYIGNSDSNWKKCKEKYPNAQIVEPDIDVDLLKKKSFTKMFWAVWDDVILNDDFNLNDYRATEWDDMYVHIFKNGKYIDGICLIPKHRQISQHDFEYRTFDCKKEIDIEASKPCQTKSGYEIFYADTYQEYLEALQQSQQRMFWIVPSNVNVNDDFLFDYQVPRYNQDKTHIFLNGKHHDGIMLCSKANKLLNKEFDYKFPVHKQAIDIQASQPKPYDIVFISYNEPNADANYKALQQRFPQAKRVHGVKGIHQAHVAAAKLCDTKMFWVVDGDAQIVDEFNFDYQVPDWEKDIVHVWRSKNPINDLEYGYGGVKLLPRKLTIQVDTSKPDMTTSISSKFKAMPEISNVTAFNTDEFSAWRSAFRECAKLASKTIRGQVDEETESRLQTWTTQGSERRFGDSAIQGARCGSAFGSDNRHNPDRLSLINDFEWLYNEWLTNNE